MARGQAGPGIYEATCRPGKPGKYILAVSAADAKGKPLGTDELPLTVSGRTRETERLARDGQRLRAIARRGAGEESAPAGLVGRYVELSALPEVVDDLRQRQRAQAWSGPPPRVYPLYNFPLLFFLFVAFLTAEWLLRRNWQLQ